MKRKEIINRLKSAGSLYAFGKAMHPNSAGIKKASLEIWTRRRLGKLGIAIPKTFRKRGRPPLNKNMEEIK